MPENQKRAKLPFNQLQTSKRSFKQVGDFFTKSSIYFDSITIIIIVIVVVIITFVARNLRRHKH